MPQKSNSTIYHLDQSILLGRGRHKSPLSIDWVDTDTDSPTKFTECSRSHRSAPMDTLTVIDHGEAKSLESLFPPETIEEIHGPSPLLPIAQLEVEAHLR